MLKSHQLVYLLHVGSKLTTHLTSIQASRVRLECLLRTAGHRDGLWKLLRWTCTLQLGMSACVFGADGDDCTGTTTNVADVGGSAKENRVPHLLFQSTPTATPNPNNPACMPSASSDGPSASVLLHGHVSDNAN